MLLILIVSLSFNALLIYGVVNREKRIKRLYSQLQDEVNQNSLNKINLYAKQQIIEQHKAVNNQ